MIGAVITLIILCLLWSACFSLWVFLTSSTELTDEDIDITEERNLKEMLVYVAELEQKDRGVDI